MGFFGGNKTPKDDWSAMSTVIKAEAKLQTLGEITPSRRAGVIYRDNEDNAFLTHKSTYALSCFWCNTQEDSRVSL